MPQRSNPRRRKKQSKEKPIPVETREENRDLEQEKVQEQQGETIQPEQPDIIQDQDLIQNDDRDEHQDHKSWWHILEGIVGCFFFTMLTCLLLNVLVKVKLDEKVINGLIVICLTVYGLYRYFRKVAPLAYFGGITCLLFLFYPSSSPITYYSYFEYLYNFLHAVTSVQNILLLYLSIWFGCFFLPNALVDGHRYGNSTKTCAVIYIIGIIYCLCIVYPFKSSTTQRVSSNWTSTFNKSNTPNDYFMELQTKAVVDYPLTATSLHPWIIEQMKEIGLDVYTHNFSFQVPMHKYGRVVHAKNIYGILRCPRSTSTQSMVLSIPMKARFPDGATEGASTLAMMLAFAKFAIKKNYWKRDIIFLIPELEGIGVQAWLEAYHGVTMGRPGVIHNSDLKGRAGRIIAAINLELLHSVSSRVLIKVDGLNGKLPDLDLVNLAVTVLKKNRVPATLKHEYYLKPKEWYRPFSDILYWYMSFKTALAMVTSQASGFPDGQHGVFIQFGINSITLRGILASRDKPKQIVPFLNIGKILDGMFGSINNLENGFYNNSYLYLLTSPQNYISYGVYFPSICIFIGALFYKAFVIFDQFMINMAKENEARRRKKPRPKLLPPGKPRSREDKYKEILQTVEPAHPDAINIFSIINESLLITVAGFTMEFFAELTIRMGTKFGYSDINSLFYGSFYVTYFLGIIALVLPLRRSVRNVTLFNVFLLLILGTVLFSIAFLNFSLALVCTVIYVPLALILSHNFFTKYDRAIKVFAWVLAHPLAIHFWTTMIYAYTVDDRDVWRPIYFGHQFFHGLDLMKSSMRDCIDFAIIFNHYHFNIVTCVFIPIWIGLGIIAFKKSL